MHYLPQEARDYCEQYGLFHFEVSAKANINIQEVFLTIAKKIPLINREPNKEIKVNKYCNIYRALK